MSDDMTTTTPLEGSASRRKMLAGMGVAAGGGLLALAGSQTASAAVSNSSYYSYGPQRYVDTRVNSGGRISGNVVRNLPVFAGGQDYTFACNITVVGTQGAGSLEFYNADLATRPSPYSSINWMTSGQVIANFTLLDLGAAGANVYCSPGASVSTHFIIDVVGFFFNNGAAGAPLPESFQRWEAKAKRHLAQDSR
jgi:hypothetical protein